MFTLSPDTPLVRLVASGKGKSTFLITQSLGLESLLQPAYFLSGSLQVVVGHLKFHPQLK
jgi:hypothetical protein